MIVFSFLSQNSKFSNCFPIIVFPAFILCTILITIAGYLINDFFDYKIDEINKPSKLRLSKASILKLYFFNVVLGLLIAIFIANKFGNLNYVFVYLLAVIILFLYASHFKELGLFGNLVVSIFSSLVIGVSWYFYNLFCSSEPSSQTNSIIILFMCFVFLCSMAREIVKDCQDIIGDSALGLRTLPIRIGINKTTFFIQFYIAALILVIFIWIHYTFPIFPLYKSLILGLINVILIYTAFKTNKAKDALEFKSISKLLKLSMALGILYLFTLCLPT